MHCLWESCDCTSQARRLFCTQRTSCRLALGRDSKMTLFFFFFLFSSPSLLHRWKAQTWKRLVFGRNSLQRRPRGCQTEAVEGDCRQILPMPSLSSRARFHRWCAKLALRVCCYCWLRSSSSSPSFLLEILFSSIFPLLFFLSYFPFLLFLLRSCVLCFFFFSSFLFSFNIF